MTSGGPGDFDIRLPHTYGMRGFPFNTPVSKIME